MKFWGGYVVGKSVGSCRKKWGVDMIKTNRIYIKISKEQVKLLFKSNIVLAKPKDVANTVLYSSLWLRGKLWIKYMCNGH